MEIVTDRRWAIMLKDKERFYLVYGKDVCGSVRKQEIVLQGCPSPQSASLLKNKKLRRFSPQSPSSVHFSPPLSTLEQVQALFPLIDPQLLERVLLECSNDIDTTIKRLHELCIGLEEAAGVESGPVEELGTTAEPGILTNGREAAAVGVQNPPATENLPVDGAEWVDLFVREMVSATNVNDAKVRASKLLEVLEKAINNHEAEEASKTFLKENVMLKEQVEILTQENRVLKRSVAIQHERQKEYQDKNYELQQLRQLVSQYQEQLQTLQMNNFTLTMHFRQTQ
ncbi:uncharacterized protein LOC120118278 [Hibiscus syriacus]|uniref:uncharacterized protein LOC120118278 n=1 Tax=Hibiscus syriacus TaxID=106335 RepID=UPI001922AA3E|nr:uncharacterized protein LOC120118278 [Hibiscus syriacus]